MNTDGAPAFDERFVAIADPVDQTEWRIDVGFLSSRWQCIWGKGCQGILDEPAEHLNQGCCSEGAKFLDQDEAMMIGALGMTLDPARFQFAKEAAEGGIYADEQRTLTRVVDGACIFHNRPGFAGGEGCALHLSALDDNESPIDWKPSVCWQLPVRIDHGDDGVKTLRSWNRTDWGSGGGAIAWCCTEESEPFTGDQMVVDSLAEELTALTGQEVWVEIKKRIAADTPAAD